MRKESFIVDVNGHASDATCCILTECTITGLLLEAVLTQTYGSATLHL